jgi:hypothetical protein
MFDENFKAGFGVSTFGRKPLRKVGRFYRDRASPAQPPTPDPPGSADGDFVAGMVAPSPPRR